MVRCLDDGAPGGHQLGHSQLFGFRLVQSLHQFSALFDVPLLLRRLLHHRRVCFQNSVHHYQVYYCFFANKHYYFDTAVITDLILYFSS